MSTGCFAFLMRPHVGRLKHLSVTGSLTVSFQPSSGEKENCSKNTHPPHLHLSKMPRSPNTVSPASFHMKVGRSGEVQVDRQISSYRQPVDGRVSMSLWQS